jgi:hypothetical protein
VDPTQPHAFLISNEYAFDESHWGTSIADLSLDNSIKPAPADMVLASTAITPSTGGFVDESVALFIQFAAAGLEGVSANGSGGYTASPTSETIFGEASLLTKPTT